MNRFTNNKKYVLSETQKMSEHISILFFAFTQLVLTKEYDINLHDQM